MMNFKIIIIYYQSTQIQQLNKISLQIQNIAQTGTILSLIHHQDFLISPGDSLGKS